MIAGMSANVIKI